MPLLHSTKSLLKCKNCTRPKYVMLTSYVTHIYMLPKLLNLQTRKKTAAKKVKG